jgi:hypothetical protein
MLLSLITSLMFSLPAFALDQFSTEAEARMHCPRDTVVWLNLPTMIWRYKGQRWYGNTKHGAYVCDEKQPRAVHVQHATASDRGALINSYIPSK